jgi:hypothetical protein
LLTEKYIKEMKRDNWTNEEVIDILEGMKMVNRLGQLLNTFDISSRILTRLGQ